MLYHGEADTTIPIESSRRFLQLLHAAGVASELHSFAGAPHIFDRVPEFASACALLGDLFIDRYVLNPHPFPGTQGAGEGRG